MKDTISQVEIGVPMRRIIAFLFVQLQCSLTCSFAAESELGIGLLSVEFNETTLLKFYALPKNHEPVKVLEFFNDKSINSWNIKNLKNERQWLKPETLWLDYSSLVFRCKSVRGDWMEVIVNNESGLSYWLQKNSNIKFKTWETFLKEMFVIERAKKYPQRIRRQPVDESPGIRYDGEGDCFQIKSMKGNWVEVFTPGHCDNKTKIKSGWIQWRKGKSLLISYFITS